MAIILRECASLFMEKLLILYLYYVLHVYRRLLLLLSYSHERRVGDRFEETNNLLISSWRYTEIAL